MENENVVRLIFALLGVVTLSVIVSAVVIFQEFLKFVKLNRKYKEMESPNSKRKPGKEEMKYIPVSD